MKEITLKRLTLHDFKGAKDVVVDLGSEVTTISGRNGIGKSRLYDAFLWLLFGKDAQDRADYEIKTRINGEELHHCDCTVIGKFEIDGQNVELKRSLVENWTKPHGSLVEEFAGHSTKVWYNNVPLKISEYKEKVASLIEPTLFKLISNPTYFTSLPWETQREQLFMLCGEVKDGDIAIKDPRFLALMDKISGKTLSEYKKELSFRRKNLKSELEQIQPRIDQTIKMMPEAEDFDLINGEVRKIDETINGVDKALCDISEAEKMQDEERQKKREEVARLKERKLALVQDYNLSRRKEIEEKNRKIEEENRSIRAKKTGLEISAREKLNDKRKLDGQIETLRNRISWQESQIEQQTEKIKSLREEWIRESERSFVGQSTCSFCGQPLPLHLANQAKEAFEQEKAKRLIEIDKTGKGMSASISALETEKAKWNVELQELYAKAEIALKEHDELKEELDLLPNSEAALIPWHQEDSQNIPGVIELEQRIEDVEKSITPLTASTQTEHYASKKRELLQERDTLVNRLSKKSVIEKHSQEVERLKERGKMLASEMAELETDLRLIQDFTKAKIDECEERINRKFKLVKFRLFKYTQDGNPVETCIPMVEGVPYGTKNKAGQINAGIDIINTFSTFYGVSVPIFIDNCESVNHLLEAVGQVVRLQVTTDQKMVIMYNQN